SDQERRRAHRHTLRAALDPGGGDPRRRREQGRSRHGGRSVRVRQATGRSVPQGRRGSRDRTRPPRRRRVTALRRGALRRSARLGRRSTGRGVAHATRRARDRAERRQGPQRHAQRRRLLRSARSSAGETRAAAARDRRAAGCSGFWRRPVTGLPASVAAAVLLVATLGAAAQDIDYDPRRPQELRPCDEHMHRGRINEARECYALLLSSQDSVTHAEAAWALGDLRTANELFRRSVRLDEQAVQPRSRWARLFLQTHQYADAIKLFREALEISPDDVHAKLGLAQVFAERFEGQAKTLLQEVLGQDDQLLGAQLLAARMALEEGQFEQADKALDAAARIASRRELPPLEVYSLRAALDLSRERSPDAWIDRALAYNPRYGAVFQELAHFEVMRRRYAQASVLLRRAIEVQPELWSAHAELGSNLLRLGELAQARSHLTKAYSGDPYSPTIVNSLRLLDRIGEFELISEPVYAVGRQFEVKLRLHRSEAAALRPYVMELASKGVQQFSQRYGFTLHEPVTLELYPDHDDFAVRVAALPGIGLLGVTFGYVVAMDSPSGRPSGEFHWGGTLWHELAHVFTLEATGHRVPRWLSEGLSVFEEWRTGPAPGVAVTMDAIAALRDKRFLPIDELDSGFIRP